MHRLFRLSSCLPASVHSCRWEANTTLLYAATTMSKCPGTVLMHFNSFPSPRAGRTARRLGRCVSVRSRQGQGADALPVALAQQPQPQRKPAMLIAGGRRQRADGLSLGTLCKCVCGNTTKLQALLFKERNKKASHSTDTAPTTQGPIPDSPRCHNMYMHGEVWDVED